MLCYSVWKTADNPHLLPVGQLHFLPHGKSLLFLFFFSLSPSALPSILCHPSIHSSYFICQPFTAHPPACSDCSLSFPPSCCVSGPAFPTLPPNPKSLPLFWSHGSHTVKWEEKKKTSVTWHRGGPSLKGRSRSNQARCPTAWEPPH